MSWRRADPKDKVVIRDYLVQNYEYLGDGRIRHKGSEKARKGTLGTRYFLIVLRIKNRQYCLFYHQAVWIMCHGDYPKGEIDHIDGDRLNNRIENLREVTPSENDMNRVWAWRPNASTGLPGISKSGNRFEIKVGGKRYVFRDKYEAFYMLTMLGRMFREE